MSTGFDSPSWYVSLIPFVVLIATLSVVVHIFGADSLEGGSQVALLFASGVTISISMVFYKKPWEELENAIIDNVRSIGSAILILLMIGAVAGTWMISGVVPTLIYYGMNALTPAIFLLATCIISALVSLMTGSSWTTIATIGVALIGIGTALGFSPGWTAGAIISGAYFGDKVSPLSDTTILASSSSGTALFTHIRYMLVTTVPSFAIACIVFLVASICHSSPESMQAAEFSASLKESFNISPWLFLVPVLTAVFIIRKLPALLTLFLATLLACIAALVFQPHTVYEVANGSPEGFSGLSFIDGFKGLMVSCYGSTAIQTGNEALNDLVSTRGMTGMLNTVFLIISAVTFGGSLSGSGMLWSLTELLTRFVNRAVTIVAATVGTGIFCNMITGDQYLSIILTSQMYRKAYDEKGFQHRLLSRSVEDSATVTSVLIPWNSCGMTQATVLKVATMEYLPYCIFNLLSPVMSIFMAAIGYRISRKVTK
ncbi:MAG: sodium:proton antiporter [Bacteroidales bacterium]|nr:sodium:proton antiporter [Bacteroides sp.]MCM1503290.1 sodium:proton antiporter [Bacteroidales bacterium]